jgi:hypothetical protein
MQALLRVAAQYMEGAAASDNTQATARYTTVRDAFIGTPSCAGSLS